MSFILKNTLEDALIHVCGGDAHHQKRRYDPIHKDAEGNLLPQPLPFCSKEQMQRLESDFAEDGVHHHKKPGRCSSPKSVSQVSKMFS
jgi:hypothetical protein